MTALVSHRPVTDGEVLFFGVGAQKCGTTWLYDHLHAHPQVYMPHVKETHFFSHRQTGSEEQYSARLVMNMRTYVAQEHPPKLSPDMMPERLGDLATLVSANLGRGSYMALYDLRSDRQRVFGEISPSYALLPAETFQEMAALASDVRFFLIMRDPVRRFWSSVRMLISNRKKVLDRFGSVRNLFFAELKKGINSLAARSDYVATMQQLEAAVPREKIHYMFYEDLLGGDVAKSTEALQGLCDFLGIAPFEAEFDRKVWKTDETKVRADELDDEMLNAALERFAPVYAGIRDRFGKAVPDRWHDPDTDMKTLRLVEGDRA